MQSGGGEHFVPESLCKGVQFKCYIHRTLQSTVGEQTCEVVVL